MPDSEDEGLWPSPEARVDAAADRIQQLAERICSAERKIPRVKVDAALRRALDEVRSLTQALRTRTVIGEAVGVLMIQRTLNADDAFAALVDASSHSNRKVRTLAREIVADACADADSAALERSQPAHPDDTLPAQG